MIKIYIKLNIRNIRTAHNMSQKELAVKCGLSQSYISRLSLGLKSPTLEVLALIATALNTHPYDLIEIVFDNNKYIE